MDTFTPLGLELQARVKQFMDELVHPREAEFYRQYDALGEHSDPPILEELKSEAKARGLWNLFLPHLRPDEPGTRLSNLDYAPISEELGKVYFAPEIFNCSAPDSGNMEILHLYGSEAIKQRWLAPLLQGEIRSSFAMTEPDVASSDATNISLRIERDGDNYVLNGRKWFTTGIMADRAKVMIVMGKTDPDAPRHRQQSMIVVPKETPGVTVLRSLSVFGYQHRGGHGEVDFRDVRVPVDNLLGEEGGGFAISQARLGPGRIHHCMRSVGLAERALDLMIDRALTRSTFGQPIAARGLVQHWIAQSRIEIDMARQYVLHTANLMDTVGNKAAATEIAGIKVAVPNITVRVMDRAVQIHGGAGVSADFPVAEMWAHERVLRIADGPDEVHEMTIARRELLRRDPSFRPSNGHPEHVLGRP